MGSSRRRVRRQCLLWFTAPAKSRHGLHNLLSAPWRRQHEPVLAPCCISGVVLVQALKLEGLGTMSWGWCCSGEAQEPHVLGFSRITRC